MIDFRYHLVSIMAVLIALSIGVVLGTGTLGGPLLDDLENNVRELRERNADLESEIGSLEDRLAAGETFTERAHAFVIAGALSEQQVVVVEMQGSPGELADIVRSDIALAGGTVVTTIELREKLRLDEQVHLDELALVISSVQGEANPLREEAATLLGSRLATAATGGAGSGAASLLRGLDETGFVDVETTDQSDPVPSDAAFIVIGGTPSDAPYDVASFVARFATSLGEAGVPVVLAEPAGSVWGIVEAIRSDGDARDVVATVDNAGTFPGRAAAILGLQRALTGNVSHLGIGSGAEVLLPEPSLEP